MMFFGMNYTSTYQSEAGLFSLKMFMKKTKKIRPPHTQNLQSSNEFVRLENLRRFFSVVCGSSALLLGPTVGAQRDRNASQRLSSWSGKLTLPTTCPFSPCAGMEDRRWQTPSFLPSTLHFRHCAHIRSNNGEWLCLTR